MERYVLDTSALIALRKDETGADEVEKLLRLAQEKKTRIFVSFISFMEIFYLSWRLEGKATAHRIFLELKMLPIERINPDDSLLFFAGELKANYPMSVADSWIAATALQQEAILVHKDPEFDSLKDRLSLKKLF